MPLEIGRPGAAAWREEACTLQDFMARYMAPSLIADGAGALPAPGGTGAAPQIRGAVAQSMHGSAEARSTADADDAQGVAYLAQHSIFEQVPELAEDVAEPELWQGGYAVRNLWMGTRGTVTPLHYDNLDNFFCQVAGVRSAWLRSCAAACERCGQHFARPRVCTPGADPRTRITACFSRLHVYSRHALQLCAMQRVQAPELGMQCAEACLPLAQGLICG
jgi:Cupin-like domain